MTSKEALHNINIFEEENKDLYDITISGLSLWRINRRKILHKYIYRPLGIKSLAKTEFKIFRIIKVYFISLAGILKLLLTKRKASNIFWGHLKLEKIDDHYIDKLVEPILYESGIGDDYIYMERGRQGGKHFKPRKLNHIVYSEAIDFSSKFFALLFSPFFYLMSIRKFSSFFKFLNKIIQFSVKDKIIIVIRTLENILTYKFLKFIFRSLKIKQLFEPCLILDYPMIKACKNLGIKCYELQHGITLSNTITYSSLYDEKEYPDYFLAFGESSMNELFNYPADKMMNIGYAFNTFLSKNVEKTAEYKNTFLLLSEQEVTEKFVETISQLGANYPQYNFHLRLHPDESILQEQDIKIKQHNNTKLVGNTVNSNIVTRCYDGVIGENSTVLFEAVSLGVKAARLNFNGLNPKPFFGISKENDPFFYMNAIGDFDTFIKFQISDNDKNLFYSVFNKDKFDSLLSETTGKKRVARIQTNS